MKKILFVATIDQHIRHFHYPFLNWFKSQGYDVHVASNGNEELLHVDLKYNIPFQRSPFKIKNVNAYRQLKKLINANQYKVIHCHTPMAAVLTRIASTKARNKGTKVVYTAHGFHFYQGASIKNWLLYYPIEKLLSKFTDVLITINEEDYNLAVRKRFKSTQIVFVKGVGIDLTKFPQQTINHKNELRNKYFYDEYSLIIIYVGELSTRKNQEILIRMAVKLKKEIPEFKLLLVGEGDQLERYKKLIKNSNVQENVELLGYRNDISNLMLLSDLAVSSSKQAGLPVNIMEAMAIGLPIVASNCRGNRDLVQDGVNGFIVNSDNEDEYFSKIMELHNNSNLKQEFSRNSNELISEYSREKINKKMADIYNEILNKDEK